MPEQWVINASPLIALAHIGHENLLFDLADKTVIPVAVQTEIKRVGPQPKDAPKKAGRHQ